MVVDFVIRDALDEERARILEITLAAYQEYGAVLPAEHWQRYREDIRRTLADVTQAEQISQCGMEPWSGRYSSTLPAPSSPSIPTRP